MKRILRTFATGLLIVAMAATTVGCGGTATSTSASTDKTLTFTGENPDTLNSIVSQSNTSMDALYLIEAGLFRYDNGSIVNDLCDDYTVSDDGLTYEFHIRDSKWSDGQTIKASEFEYAMKQMLSVDTDSVYGFIFYGNPTYSEDGETVTGESGVVNSALYAFGVTDDWSEVGVKSDDENNTLTIKLNEPDVDFITRMTKYGFYPVREDAYTAAGEAYGSYESLPLCSGPYVVTDWTLDSEMKFVNNSGYWDQDSWAADNIDMKIISSDSSKYQMLMSGEVDAVSSIGSTYASQLGSKVHKALNSSINMLIVNSLNPSGTRNAQVMKVLSNENFRNALSYAIDRNSLAETINDSNEPIDSLVLPMFVDENGDSIASKINSSSAANLSGDSEKANEYLEAALAELNMTKEDITALGIKLQSWTSDERTRESEAVIDMWKNTLGITIQLEQYSPSVVSGQNFGTSNYDILYFTVGGAVSPSELMDYFKFYDGIYYTGTYQSTSIMKTMLTLNQAEKYTSAYYSLLSDANDLYIQEANYIPLSESGQYYVLSDNVSNIYFSEFGYEFKHVEFK